MNSPTPLVGWHQLTLNEQVATLAGVSTEGEAQTSVSLPPVTSQRPVFARSPREFPVFLTDEVEVQSPKDPPTPPTLSWMTLFLPMGGVIISLIVVIVAASFSTTSVGVGALMFSVPMMLVSVGAGYFQIRKARSQYEAAKRERDQRYRAYLDECQIELNKRVEQQQNASRIIHPSLDECFQRVQTRARRLWEREPAHEDFLRLRLGAGELPRAFAVKAPGAANYTLRDEPLVVAATQLVRQYDRVKDIAATLPLRQLSAGVVGARAEALAFVRALLMQLATHHSPTEVKLVIFAPYSELQQWDLSDDKVLAGRSEWGWARWLPHVWDDKFAVRLIGDDLQRVLKNERSLAHQLEAMLRQRLNTESGAHLPEYVIVMADARMWSGPEAEQFGAFVDLLLQHGPLINAHALFVADIWEHVPKACGAVIEVTTQQAALKRVEPNAEPLPFSADFANRRQAERLARALAPVRLESILGNEAPPTTVSLLDVLEQKRMEDIAVPALWNASRPFESMNVPFAMRRGNQIMSINLQETTRPGGYGAHALVGGTTGTGKTQFLQTLIVLTCAHFRPDEVNFVLVDYKGGDLQLGLKDKLPHLVGSLANVNDPNRQSEKIQRVFAALEAEALRRKQILGGQNINDYIAKNYQAFRRGEPGERLPHLFIIIDEFAELIQRNPDLELPKRFKSIAALGRSLGMHLILATQSPGNVMSDDLRDNINTRIALRMGSNEASRQILRRSEAHDRISKDLAGRAYIQVGNNDIFESIQVAYGGVPADTVDLAAISSVQEVEFNGALSATPPNLVERMQKAQTPVNRREMQNQLLALAEDIGEAAVDLNIPKPRPIRLDGLPELITLGEVRTKFWKADAGWNGKDAWRPAPDWLSPVIGLCDVLDQPELSEFAVSLSQSNHWAIYGASGSGRSSFLRTLIVSLAHWHSPRDLHLYLLDFGGVETLRVFESLPHTGAMILPDQSERLGRLFALLRHLIDERRTLLSQNNCSTLNEYRALGKPNPPPDVVVVLDGLPNFIDTFRTPSQTVPELDDLTRLVVDQSQMGLHLVVTAEGLAGFPVKLRNKIRASVALALNKADDYLDILGKRYTPSERIIPGRGVSRGNPPIEFQVAWVSQPADELKQIFEGMAQAWRPNPPVTPIPLTPESLPLSLLEPQIAKAEFETDGFAAPLGLELAKPDLPWASVALATGPHFWVVSPDLIGRANLLQVWVLALARRYSPDQLKFYLVDLGGYNLADLRRLPHVFDYVDDGSRMAGMNLEEQFDPFLSGTPNAPALVMVIDGFGAFRTLQPKPEIRPKNLDFLQMVINQGRRGVYVIAAGAPADFPANAPLADAIKRYQSGFYVGSNEASAAKTNFGLQFRAEDARRAITPFTAFWVKGSGYKALQVTEIINQADTLQAWIGREQNLAGKTKGGEA